MTPLSPAEVRLYFSSRLPNFKQAGPEWRGPCPIHHGKRDSFSVDPESGRWFCHSECDRGGDIFDLEREMFGGDFKSAKEAVVELTGMQEQSNGHQPSEFRTVAKYDYTDESGKLIFQVHRRENGHPSNKKFAQCQIDATGSPVWNLQGARLVPFRLPKLLTSQLILVVEGEKAVIAAESLGFTATCNPMGAGKWRPAYSEHLSGKDVVILPDNDAPGKKHAKEVSELLTGVAASVKIVDLPGIPEKGDIVEWIAAGGTRDDLLALIEPEEPDETPLDYVPWPEPLSEAAFHGPIGRLAKLIEPNTEADVAAVLLQAIVMVGNVVGRSAHFMAEGTPHFCNEFVGIVGATAKGRKGSSYGQVKAILSPIAPEWASKRTKSGLTSGEGLIFHVRDEIREVKQQKGQMVEVVVDPGEADKRMLVVEEELSSAIKAMSREGNTLSGVLRQAWDSPMVLAPMTKNNRITASHPHVSIIGHITRDELLKSLKAVENTNGGTNRFLWGCAKRSKLLPFGGRTTGKAVDEVANDIDCAIGWAQMLTTEITFDAEAAEMWSIVYEQLGDIPAGTIGAILSRAEPHVRRVAMIYAIMDRSHLIRPEHLEAALEIWRYSSDSVRWIFGGIDSGETVQSKAAEKIARFIDTKPDGCCRRDIAQYMGGKVKAAEIEFHLSQLLSNGKIRVNNERRNKKAVDFYYRA